MTPLEQQLLAVQLHLAQADTARDRALESARRRVSRIASVLGMVATVVAMYDLSLLATLGHR